MRILHLASFDRWTGAAAPAFVEARMLREAGHDAFYGYVGSYLLERKIGHLDWTSPILQRGHGPLATLRSIGSVRREITRRKISIVHAHLSHDHWIARAAIVGLKGIRLVRTFHSERAMRTDLLSLWLIRSTAALAVVNFELLEGPAAAARDIEFTPPPLEPQYQPEGPDARSLYGIGEDTPVIGYIGKVSPGRGFEDALRAFAIVHAAVPAARMLIIGHGPHRKELEKLSESLEIASAVVWAGYHEEDLPDHFRAMDLMFFAATGSDWGHRAIIEANGCGTPVISYPLPGVEVVVGDRDEELVTSSGTPESLADRALQLLSEKAAALRPEMVANASRFAAGPIVDRLLRLYR